MNFPIPPALILILGALAVPFMKGRIKNLYVIALPLLALLCIDRLPEGNFLQFEILRGFGDVTMLRVDKLSKAFGYIFTINAVAAFIYAFHLKDNTQHISALIYIGSALGAVFAGDVITLYIYWEIMAVASTMLILARKSTRSYGAGYRYVLMHILGGLFLLAGIVMSVSQTGSIAFDAFTERNLGNALILLGFLVNAAAPPFSAWLSDAYPESTVTGAIILSAYTTKTAVYTLIRGFPGWEILIGVGCAMAIYGIIFALLENDMRRILAYSIINQVGFMVCAVGIGTNIALNGAVAHAFCHIIYKSLLWMSAGAVLYRVGKSKCTELGGLYKSMPWSLAFGCIGALAISAVPLTSGFTSKTMIIQGAAEAHLQWVWIVLDTASAGVFLHAGIKFPYFVFFARDSGLRPKEAPIAMLVGMAILAFFCIYLGVHYQSLHAILPFAVDYEYRPYTFEHVTTVMQLLLFSALTFFVFLPMLKRTDTIVLDTDWFFRRGGSMFTWIADKSLNGINRSVHGIVLGRWVPGLVRFFRRGPARIMLAAMTPLWKACGIEGEALEHRRRAFFNKTQLGAFPVGATAFVAVVLMALLFLF